MQIQNQKKNMVRTANEQGRLNEVETILQRMTIDAGNLKHLIPMLSQTDHKLFQAHQYEGSLFVMTRRSNALLETAKHLKTSIYE